MSIREAFAAKRYTEEEYLELEWNAIEKHEYHAGKIIKMSGADPIHNLIAARLITLLNNYLDRMELDYFVLGSDTKIRIPEYDRFVYSDAVVVCESIERYAKDPHSIVNPLLVAEILSPSTADHDRTMKFQWYKSLPSFKEYVLIRQDKPWVNTFYKRSETTWEDTIVDNLEASIALKSIDCALALSDVYRGVF